MRVKREAARERRDFMEYVGLKEVVRWRSKDFLMKLRPRRKINYCELSPSHNDFETEKSIVLEELVAINGQLRKYLQWFQSYAASNRVDESTCTTFEQFIKKLRKYKLKLLGSCYKPKQFYKQIFLDTTLAQTFAANVQKYSDFIKEHYREIDTPFSHPSPELAERIQTNLENEAASFTLVITNLHQKNKQIESSLITRYKKIDLPDFNNNDNMKHFKKRLLVRLDLDRLGMGDKSKTSKLRAWRRKIFPYKYHNGMELHKLGRKEDATQKTRQVIRRLKSERNMRLYVKIQRSAYEEFISTGQYYINLFKSSLEIFRRYYLNHLKTTRKKLFAQLNALDFAYFQHGHFLNSLIYYSSCCQNWTGTLKEELIKRGMDIAKTLFGTKKTYLDVVTCCFHPVNKKDKIKKSMGSSSIKFKEKENDYLGQLLEGKLIIKSYCKSIESTNIDENYRPGQVLSLKNVNLSENLAICGGRFGGSDEDLIIRKEIGGNKAKLNERLLLESDSISFGDLTSRNEIVTLNYQIGQTSSLEEIVDGEMKIGEISVVPNEDLDLGNGTVFCGNASNLTARSECAAISNGSPNRNQIGQISSSNAIVKRIPDSSIIPNENLKLKNYVNGGNCSTRSDTASFPIGKRIREVSRSNQTITRTKETQEVSIILNDGLKDDSICLGRGDKSTARNKVGSVPIGNQIGQIPRSNQTLTGSKEIQEVSIIRNDDLGDDSICLGRGDTSTGKSNVGSFPLGNQIGPIPRSNQTITGSKEIEELSIIRNDDLKDDSSCLGRGDKSNARGVVGSFPIGNQIGHIPKSNETITGSKEIQEVSIILNDDFKGDSSSLGRGDKSNTKSKVGSVPIANQFGPIPRSNQTLTGSKEIQEVSIIHNDDLGDDSICLGRGDTSTGKSKVGSFPLGNQIGPIPRSNQTITESKEIQELSIILNDDFKDDSICLGRGDKWTGRSKVGSFPIGNQIGQIPRSNQTLTGSKEIQELSIIRNDDLKDDSICLGRGDKSTARSKVGSFPIGNQIRAIPRSNQTITGSKEIQEVSIIRNDDLKDDSSCLGRGDKSTGRSKVGSVPIGNQIGQIPRSNQTITASKEIQEVSIIINDDFKDDSICLGRRDQSSGRSNVGSFPIGNQIGPIPRSNQTITASKESREVSIVLNEDFKDDSICLGRGDKWSGRSKIGSFPIGNQIGPIPRSNETITGSKKIQELSIIRTDDLKDDSIFLGREDKSNVRSEVGSFPNGNQIGQIPRSNQTMTGSKEIREVSIVLNKDFKDDSICLGRGDKWSGRSKIGSFPIGNQIGPIPRSNQTITASKEIQELSVTLNDDLKDNSICLGRGDKSTPRSEAGSFPFGNRIGKIQKSNQTITGSKEIQDLSIICNDVLKDDSICLESGSEDWESTARNKVGSFPIGNQIGQIPRSNETLTGSKELQELCIIRNDDLKDDSICLGRGDTSNASKVGSFPIGNQIGQIPRSNQTISGLKEIQDLSIICNDDLKDDSIFLGNGSEDWESTARRKVGSFPIGNQIGPIPSSNQTITGSKEIQDLSIICNGDLKDDSIFLGSGSEDWESTARSKVGSFPIGNQIGQVPRSNQTITGSKENQQLSIIRNDDMKGDSICLGGGDISNARSEVGSLPIGKQIGQILRSNETAGCARKMFEISVIPNLKLENNINSLGKEKKSLTTVEAVSFPIGKKIGQTSKSNETANEIAELDITPNLKNDSISIGNANLSAAVYLTNVNQNRQIEQISRSNESVSASRKTRRISVVPIENLKAKNDPTSSGNGQNRTTNNETASFPIANQMQQTARSNETGTKKTHGISVIPIENLKSKNDPTSSGNRQNRTTSNEAASFPIANQMQQTARSNETGTRKTHGISVIPIENLKPKKDLTSSRNGGNSIANVTRLSETAIESKKIRGLSVIPIEKLKLKNDSVSLTNAGNQTLSLPIGNQIGQVSSTNQSGKESRSGLSITPIENLKLMKDSISFGNEENRSMRNEAVSFPIVNQMKEIPRSNESKMHNISVIPNYQFGQILSENESGNSYQIETENEAKYKVGSFPIVNRIGQISRSNESLNETNKTHKMSVIPQNQIGQMLKENESANSQQIERGNETRNKAVSFPIGNQIRQISRSNETVNESSKTHKTPNYQIEQLLKQNEAANPNQIEKENAPISNETVNPKKPSGNLRTLYRNFGREIAANENVKSKHADENEILYFLKKMDIEEKAGDRFVEIFESTNKKRVKVPDLRIVKSNDFRKVDVLKIENLPLNTPETQFGNRMSYNVLKQVELDRNCCENRENNNIRIPSVYTPKARRNIFDVDCCKITPNAQPQDVNKPKPKRLITFNLEENVSDAETDYEVNILRKLTGDFNKTVEYYFGPPSVPSLPKQPKFENPQNPQNYENQMFNSPVNKFPYKSNIRTEIYRTHQVSSKIYEFYFDSPTLVNLNSEILQLYNYPEHRVVLSWMNHATSIIRPKFGNCFPFISHVSTMQGLVYVEHQSLQEESLISPYVIALAPAVTQVILELLTNPHSQLQESLTLTIAISPETSPSQIACYTQFIFSYLHNYKHRYTVLGRNPSLNPKKKRKESANRVKVLSNIRISPGKRKCEDLNNENYSRDLLQLLKNSEETGRESCKLSAKKFGAFLYWDAEDGMMINCDFSKDKKQDSVNSKRFNLPTYEEHMMGNYLRRREKIFEDNQMARANMENQNNNNSEIQTNFELENQNSIQNLNAFPQTNHLPEHLSNIPNQLPIHDNDTTENLESYQILNVAELCEIITSINPMISEKDLTDVIDNIEGFIQDWLAIEKFKQKEAYTVKNPSSNKTASNNRRKSKSPNKIAVVENSLQTKLTNIANALVDILTKTYEVTRDTADVNILKICDVMQKSYDNICNFEAVTSKNGTDGPQLENWNTMLFEKLLSCFRKPKTSEGKVVEESVLNGEMLSICNKTTSEENEGKLIEQDVGKMQLICNRKIEERTPRKVKPCRKVSIEDVVARCNKKMLNSTTVQKENGEEIVGVENRDLTVEQQGDKNLCRRRNLRKKSWMVSSNNNLTMSNQTVLGEVKTVESKTLEVPSKVFAETLPIDIQKDKHCEAKQIHLSNKFENRSKSIGKGKKNLCKRRNLRKKAWRVSSNKKQTISKDTVLGEVKTVKSKAMEVSSKVVSETLPMDIQEDNPCETKQIHLSNNFEEISNNFIQGKKNLCKRRNLRKKSRRVYFNKKQTISEQRVLGQVKTAASKTLEVSSKVSAKTLPMDIQKGNSCEAKKIHLSNNLKEVSKNFIKGKKNLCKRRNLLKKSRRVYSNKKQTISEQRVLSEVKTAESKTLAVPPKIFAKTVPIIKMDIQEDTPCEMEQIHLSNCFEDISNPIRHSILVLNENTEEIFSVQDQINEEVVYTIDFPDNVLFIEASPLEALNENIIFIEESKEGKHELKAEEGVCDPSGVEKNSSEEFKKFGLEGAKSKDLRAEIVFEEPLKEQEENCNKVAKSFKSREKIDINLEEVKSEAAISKITLEEKLEAMEENCNKVVRSHNSREGIDDFNKIDLLEEQSAALISHIDFGGKLKVQEDKLAVNYNMREEIDQFFFVKLAEVGSKVAENKLQEKSKLEEETCNKSNQLIVQTCGFSKFNLEEQQTEALIPDIVLEEESIIREENRDNPRAEIVELHRIDLEEEKLEEAFISKIEKPKIKEEHRNGIPRNYNSREEIEDFNISDIYETEMTIQFDDLKPFSSISNLSNIKDNLGIDEIVLDFFMEHSVDLIPENSKSLDLQMDYEEAICEDSNDMQSTIDVTDNVYELEDSIVQINLDKYYLIYNQCKYGLNREYLDVICEKLTKAECVYMTCNKQKRLSFHAEELTNFVSCGIASKQISINVSLCVYFLVVCIKCGIDLVPDLQNYATNVLDVESYKKELALLEKCVVPDIVKDFYEFINFYNYDRGMELISFEYFVDNLWNGNLLDYYFGFLHYAKMSGICK